MDENERMTCDQFRKFIANERNLLLAISDVEHHFTMFSQHAQTCEKCGKIFEEKENVFIQKGSAFMKALRDLADGEETKPLNVLKCLLSPDRVHLAEEWEKSRKDTEVLQPFPEGKAPANAFTPEEIIALKRRFWAVVGSSHKVLDPESSCESFLKSTSKNLQKSGDERTKLVDHFRYCDKQRCKEHLNTMLEKIPQKEQTIILQTLADMPLSPQSEREIAVSLVAGKRERKIRFLKKFNV